MVHSFQRSISGDLLFLCGIVCIGGVFFWGDYDYWRWQLIVILCGISLLAVFLATPWPSLKFWFFGISLFFFGAVATVLVLIDYQFYQLYELFQWTLFLMLPPVVGLWLNRFDLTLPLLCVLLIALPVYGLFNVPHYLVWLFFEGGMLADRLPVGFPNIRLWSHLATWMLPLAPIGTLLLAQFGVNKALRNIFSLGAGCWWTLAFITTSRGTFFSFAIAMLFLAVTSKTKFFKSEYVRNIVAQFTIGFSLWLLFCVLLPILVLPDGDSIHRVLRLHSSGRIGLFHEALSMSWVNFPLGMGPLSWMLHTPVVSDPHLVKAVGTPHNMVLLIAAEFGWVSVLGVALAFGWLVIRLAYLVSVACKSREDITLVLAVVASVVAAIVHSQLSGIFITGASLLVGLAVVSIVFSLIFQERVVGLQYLERTSRHGVNLVFRVTVFALTLSLLISSWYSYQVMLDERERKAELGDFERKPRVWFQGDVLPVSR